MTQIRITQPGMETLTGNLGEIEFKDGISVDRVTQRQAHKLRGAFKIETIKGDDPGLLAEISRAKAKQESPVIYHEPELKEPELDFDYDEDSLVAIADEGGFSELRGFAANYGVKGSSIVDIIEKLLQLKAGA